MLWAFVDIIIGLTCCVATDDLQLLSLYLQELGPQACAMTTELSPQLLGGVLFLMGWDRGVTDDM